MGCSLNRITASRLAPQKHDGWQQWCKTNMIIFVATVFNLPWSKAKQTCTSVSCKCSPLRPPFGLSIQPRSLIVVLPHSSNELFRASTTFDCKCFPTALNIHSRNLFLSNLLIGILSHTSFNLYSKDLPPHILSFADLSREKHYVQIIQGLEFPNSPIPALLDTAHTMP